MYIFDRDGKQINITDLAAAIQQAGEYKEFRHLDPAFAETDQRLQTYWSDIHSKLLALQKSLQAAPTLHSHQQQNGHSLVKLLKNNPKKDG